MGFHESYKRLEKLCGEVLNDNRRISAYIDLMSHIPRGPIFVMGWNNDLKQLKHYRWIRNLIDHEPGYTEENMCKPADAEWLDSFYSRILNQTDPLALYRKALQQHTETVSRKPVTQVHSPPVAGLKTVDTQTKSAVKCNLKKKQRKKRVSTGQIFFAVYVLLAVAVIVLLLATYLYSSCTPL